MRRLLKVGLLTSAAAGITLDFHTNPQKIKNIQKRILLFAEEVQPDVLLSKPLNLSQKRSSNKECILVVGTTGSGKSSTIAKYTRQAVESSGEAESVTKFCRHYQDKDDPSKPVWIDTIGYDDTRNQEDSESFKDVLRYMSAHGLCSVRAIIWTVLPQERKDARLQRQADFINQFKEDVIWDNVIIVAKQPGSFNLSRACQGAAEAAKYHTGKTTNIQMMGFTYLDDTIPEKLRSALENLEKEERDKMLLVTDEEVISQIDEAIAKIETPVKVIFEDSKCVDCGVLGDQRLLPDFCHMGELYTHPRSLNHFHPNHLKPYHPLTLEASHSGVLRLNGGPNQDCITIRNVLTAAIPILGFLDPTAGIASAVLAGSTHVACTKLDQPFQEIFSCCSGEKSSPGCKVSYSCCRRSENNEGCCYSYPCCSGGMQAQGCRRRYQCCDKEEGSAGCKIVCKKCGKDWGSPAAKCFRKQHSLVKVD